MIDCHFIDTKSGRCCLLGEHCTGASRSCSFRKTRKEFIIAHNRAVAVNRKRGNCNNCKYKPTPCEFEVIPSDDEGIS